MIQRIRSFAWPRIEKRSFGLKAKITAFVIFIVAGVLLLSSYLDYHFARKDHLSLYLDRNLYIAKQIDAGIPDQRMMGNLPHLREEIEEWLLSRPTLMEIDIFLLSSKGWEPIISTSKWNVPKPPLALSEGHIRQLKKDRHLSSVHQAEGEKGLEVIVPLHSGKRVIGGIRVVSSLAEVEGFLNKKRERAFILTLLSIVAILITFALLFGKLVGNPIQNLVEAMSQAEQGNLEAQAHVLSQDELGELGRHFNRMLKTIRETHEQNVQLLSKVSQFNEELTRKVEAATSELARRNEELRLLNEALFESQRQLSQSEKLAALGQVTATMAHQIGTPLNSISGYIQLMLQEGNFSPMDRERLNIIESQLDRLADSVKKILAFTRQPEAQLRPVDINRVLEDLIRLSEPWFFARKVRLSASLCPDLPLVSGDPTYLQTLFLNLISNALDAMPHGGSLRIETEALPVQASGEDGEGWVRISIADTGIGITEEAKKRIFEPFFTTKKLGEGTGLGLTICEKIIKEHSGRLDVKSEVGKGSTFFVYVPACQESRDGRTSVTEPACRG
ncbi:MAG: HAMP domain-containing protein [Syntrophaceae bacterium]|nr:HAMP domain-containing protein [Syntrophaceae bacterium]